MQFGDRRNLAATACRGGRAGVTAAGFRPRARSFPAVGNTLVEQRRARDTTIVSMNSVKVVRLVLPAPAAAIAAVRAVVRLRTCRRSCAARVRVVIIAATTGTGRWCALQLIAQGQPHALPVIGEPHRYLLQRWVRG